MNNYREKLSLGNRKLNINAKDGDALASSMTPSLVFAAISAVCSLPFAISLWDSPLSEFISLIVCMVSAAGIIMCTKRVIFSVIAIATASLLVSITGSTAVCALIFAPICSISFGSAALARKKGGALSALLIATLSFLLSLLITGDYVLALLSLAVFPCTVALGICNRKKLSKIDATLTGTIVTTASAIVLVLLSILFDYGAISVETIKAATDNLAYTMSSYTEHYLSVMGNAITPEIRLSIAEIADSFINTLPGAIVAISFTVAYICQSMSLAAAERLGEDTKPRNYLSASLVTALVYVGAYLTSFTTSASGKVALAAIVASNLVIMLTPCLFIIGTKAIRIIPFKFGLIGLLLSIAIIIVMFLPFSSALTVLALTGAFFIIVESIDAWARERYSKGENQ